MKSRSIQFDQDIQPLSEFRANAATFIQKVKSERRPLVLAQHGKSTAVLLDVHEYQKMINTIELLKDLATAREELNRGEGISLIDILSELKK